MELSGLAAAPAGNSAGWDAQPSSTAIEEGN
jgi:hypothetical protein